MSTTKSNILGALLAIFSSIALFRLVVYIFKIENYIRLTEASLGVTTGHPFWKTFQSRVLGPYAIKALTFGSMDYYLTAHIWFHIATVAIAAFLCWRLGRTYGGSDQSALLGLTVFVLCFALLLSPPWLYSWDFLDIIVFIMFIDFVLSGKSLPWFIGLFAVAIWNRDSALFIALWLILDPLVHFFYRRRYKLPKIPLDWRRILAGAICIAAGLLIVELLKRNLLIEEMGPKLYPNSPINSGNRYNLVLPWNIDLLKQSLTRFSYEFWISVPVFLTMVTVLGACVARRDPQRYLAIYLVKLALLVSLLLFGWFYETRIYLILIPFVVMSAVLLSSPKTTETKTP
ncbi:MAG: hypothetical protein EXR03_01830 [Pseudolabrys sp.]|nr:hypothetical protein [Pseudolabrys sp.]